METSMAFAMGLANKDRERMVFDWDAAAKYIVKHGIQDAGAGLQDDWEWTGGPILRDGKIVPKEETYTYLASTWAQPELSTKNGTFPCWLMESETGWDENTYWPDSSRAIFDQGTDHNN